MAEIKNYSSTADDNSATSPAGWPESMPPSGVNNSDRELAARIRRWYEDVSAVKTTTGSSNAYVLAAARVVTAYAAGDAYMIKANHTCTSAGSTLNIDSVGAKSIVTPAGAALGAGDITSGGIYIIAYEASVDKFMLLAGGSTFSGDITAKTSDGSILNLQTSDTTVTAASVLGRLDFTAPDEASGTDAILVAASIAAISEGTFAADNNATKLSFRTGASEKMSISSAGVVTCANDLVVTGNATFANPGIASHLRPSADSTYDVGATASRWRQGFFDEVEIGTNTGLTASSANALFVNYLGAGSEYAVEIKTAAASGTALYFLTNTTSVVGKITVTASSTAYLTSSDYRLKENIADTMGAIARVKALKPKRFNWIVDETNTPLDGFLAHEAAEIVPEAVHGEKDAMKDGEMDFQSIDQSKLVPLLTGAIKELITKVETLESKVTALEAG